MYFSGLCLSVMSLLMAEIILFYDFFIINGTLHFPFYHNLDEPYFHGFVMVQ